MLDDVAAARSHVEERPCERRPAPRVTGDPVLLPSLTLHVRGGCPALHVLHVEDQRAYTEGNCEPSAELHETEHARTREVHADDHER
jgi:hypothetical protein